MQLSCLSVYLSAFVTKLMKMQVRNIQFSHLPVCLSVCHQAHGNASAHSFSLFKHNIKAAKEAERQRKREQRMAERMAQMAGEPAAPVFDNKADTKVKYNMFLRMNIG